MAGTPRRKTLKARPRTSAGSLVSVDGLSGGALARAAKRLATGEGTGVSWWDASGIFGDVDAAGVDVERPSARTVILLYAADLAFRLRWEIRPAMAEGRRVIAVPYIDTAIALGRAAGLDEAWLRSVFDFAPAPAERVYVDAAPRASAAAHGFLEFTCRRLVLMESRKAREDLLTRTQARLKAVRHRAAARRNP
jgi:hypothetical protein